MSGCSSSRRKCCWSCAMATGTPPASCCVAISVVSCAYRLWSRDYCKPAMSNVQCPMPNGFVVPNCGVCWAGEERERWLAARAPAPKAQERERERERQRESTTPNIFVICGQEAPCTRPCLSHLWHIDNWRCNCRPRLAPAARCMTAFLVRVRLRQRSMGLVVVCWTRRVHYYHPLLNRPS